MANISKSLKSKSLSNSSIEPNARPFLRWAGGKTWLLKHFKEIIPDFKFNNYHEPFLGGAALYFFLKPQKCSFLSDLNTDLISTYISVRDEVDTVINELKQFKNTPEDYYRIRDAQFRSDYKKAAQFIYLNQTSFNGIYRVNLQGKYNVPYGFRNVDFFKPENLKLVSTNLKKSIITHGDFGMIKKNIKKNDLIFLDPPYTVTHNNNGFIKYNQKLFSLEDQYRLSELLDTIKAKKAFYILTNAAHKTVEEIFEKNDNKFLLKRASLIGGLRAQRGHYSEVIFTNIK